MRRFLGFATGVSVLTVLFLVGLYSLASSSDGETDAPPRRLQQLKADRDNQILQAKLELARTATDLLLTVDYFKREVARYKMEWEYYRRVGPGMEAMRAGASRMIEPQKVDYLASVDRIRKARVEFDKNLKSYKTQVEQIRFQYYRSISALELEDKMLRGRMLDVPHAESDQQIGVAIRLRDNLEDEVQAILSSARS